MNEAESCFSDRGKIPACQEEKQENMSLETITEEIRGKIAMAAGFEHKVKFDFGDDGVAITFP